MGQHAKTMEFHPLGYTPVAASLGAMTSEWGRRNVRPYILRHLGVPS
jgi:hypothetical protein